MAIKWDKEAKKIVVTGKDNTEIKLDTTKFGDQSESNIRRIIKLITPKGDK